MRLLAALAAGKFHAPFRGSLLLRIVGSFFLLSCVIVVALTVFSFSFLARSARGDLVHHIDAMAAIKVATLNRWVTEQTRRAVLLPRVREVRTSSVTLCSPGGDAAAQLAAYLRLQSFSVMFMGRYPEFREISLLSAEGGRIVYSTDPSTEGQYRVLDSEFTEGRRGTSVQPVHPSPITLEPTMSIATPVAESSGKVAGVLVVNLNLDSMDRIIQDRSGLGRTAEAYLVDRFNMFVSSSRFGTVNYPRGVHSEGIDAALDGRSGTGTYRNYAGTSVIAAYRWIPERQLALLLEVPESEARRPAFRQAATLATIGFALVLVLGFGVLLLARRIAQPVLAIQQAAVQVASGNLDAVAPVLTHDEVGELAGAFNKMTATVRGLYEEIRRREEHFRSLIESSLDVVIVADAEGCCTFASPSVERVLGYSPSELLAKNLLPLIHPQDLESNREQRLKIKADRGSDFLRFTVRALHKDGSWRTLEANIRSLLDHPAIRGYVANARDITERLQLEEKLAQAQKMEAVGRLAGGVAHDFNNLLTVVIGYADALMLSDILDTQTRTSVTEIGKAASRAADLTRQLLAYSRKQVLRPRTMDLNALLSGMNSMLARLIGEDVSIIMRHSPGLKGVRADPSQVSQVIMNLAANGRDAMPHGGTILFETENVLLDADYCRDYPEVPEGEYVMLAVTDTGCGMDEITRQRLFEPFFTTKGVGKGTGLGLASVYGIVKQSGGHASVSSELGKGSTFRIYLPAAVMEDPQETAAAPVIGMARGTETILIVEDEDPVRAMICMILERAGYVVHSAATPQEVPRQLARIGRVDLLVTDVILPGMNGKELARSLRANRPSLKVLFISGYSPASTDQDDMMLPDEEFLQKPFTPVAFTQRVREVLDGRSAGPQPSPRRASLPERI